MNRRWPIITSWVLVAGVLVASLLDVLGGGMTQWVSLLGAGAAVAQLCVQRHAQHGLMASLLMISILGACLAPTVPLTMMGVASLITFALLIGSRTVARWLLRRRQAPVGGTLMILAGGIFGLSAPLLNSPHLYMDWPVALWRIPWAALVIGGIGVLSQVFATPWLVKTIPGTEADERPGVALWLWLVGWLVFTAGR